MFLVQYRKNQWKPIRDRFSNEKIKLKEQYRSGTCANSSQPWHLMALLIFLDPFVQPRRYIFYRTFLLFFVIAVVHCIIIIDCFFIVSLTEHSICSIHFSKTQLKIYKKRV